MNKIWELILDAEKKVLLSKNMILIITLKYRQFFKKNI